MTTFLTFIAAFIIFSLPAPVHAQAPAINWPNESFGEYFDQAFDGTLLGEGYLERVFNGVFTLIGCKITPTLGNCTTRPERLNYLWSQSVAGIGSRYIAYTFITPPASTYAFLQDAGQSLGFIPRKAMAQEMGIGFTGLRVLLPLWKMTRNLAYFFLAVVMIVIGFMIMFRKKIDAHTVVSIQNALPKIIITLILITFSYAIVGIAIDLMYVLMAFAASLFHSTGLMPPDTYPAGNIGSMEQFVTGGLTQNAYSIPPLEIPWRIISGIVPDQSAIDNTVYTVAGLAVAGGLLTGQVWISVLGAIGGLAMPVLGAIVALAILFLIFRLFAFFLGVYIKIIIALIVGPLQILFEAVPGTNAFSNWLRGLVSNIIVFPVASVMFMLSQVFLQISTTGGSNPIWSPPYGHLTVNNAVSIGALLSLGILFAIPTVCNQVQDSMKAKPMIDAGPTGIAGVLGQPVALGWQIGQFLMSRHQMQGIAQAVKVNQGGGSKSGH